MGVNLKIIRDVEISNVNELFILTQPAHLQKLEHSELNSPERDITRATYIRNRLAGRSSGSAPANGDGKGGGGQGRQSHERQKPE